MIQPEIQQWISRDAQFLQDCNKKRFDEYVAWFNDPATDHHPDHYTAMAQVIAGLEGTKE